MTTTRTGPSRPVQLYALRGCAFAALLAVGCGIRSPEEQVLEAFFRDARTLDGTMLARSATTTFDPRTQGSIQQFRIAQMGAERVEGGMVTREVTLTAPVRSPGGATEQRTLVATLQKRSDDGRWLVTAIR